MSNTQSTTSPAPAPSTKGASGAALSDRANPNPVAFYFQITKMHIRSEYPLPELYNAEDRAPYAGCCPNIDGIDRLIGCGIYNYCIFVRGAADLYEILGQLENLAAFYAQECDNPEFDNPENLAPCA